MFPILSLVFGRVFNLVCFVVCGSWIWTLVQNVRHKFAVAIALAFSLNLAPFLFVWVAGVQTWRYFLHRVVRRRHPELELVNSNSLRSALDTRRWPGLAVAVLLLDEADTNLSQLRAEVSLIMQSQVEKYSVLRRRLCVRFGCYLWQEDDAELDANGQLIVWPRKANTDAQLQDFIGAICSKQLPKDRPPWQVVLIPYSRSWAVLICSHHLVVDSLPPLTDLLSPTSCNLWVKNTPPLLRGKWATHTLASLVWTEPNTPTPSTILTVLRCPLTFAKLILSKFRLFAGANNNGRRYVSEAVSEILDAVKLVLIAPYVCATQLTTSVENVPLLRASVSPGNRILAWTTPVQKKLVRRIAKAGKVTDVDVLLAACAGMLRNFLVFSRAPIPDSVSAILPVVIGERNTAAFALVDLPTGEPDPIGRLRLVGRQMTAVHERPLHVLIGAIVQRYAGWFLPQTVLTLALNFLSRRHTLTVCFVDTPSEMMPHQSRLFYWRPPQGNAGLTFTIQSDNEFVSLAVASNQSVLSKPQLLTVHFSREIHAIATNLGVKIRGQRT